MDSSKRTQVHKSRILREMRNHAEHPFSPPSSTGSHGTVTLTSDISNFLPQGESTRQPMTPMINTSALHRKFPEWWQKDDTTGKENKQPASPEPARNDNSSIFGSNSPRLRVPHQAPIAEVEETMELPPLHPTSGNLTKLLNTLQTARSEKVQTEQESVKRSSQISPKSQPNTGFSADAVRRPKRQPQLNIHSTSSPSILNQTAHSFFLPQFSHLDDFLTGTLRWSSFKNGTPIFVKHGRVHDRVTKRSPDHHADFEDVNIPKEEEEIFVSLDKIREEIQILQEHDEHVSKQAEQLQSEVAELQDHIARVKSRKDSAMGSDSDSSMIMQLTTQKSQLAEKLASLRAELDQANRRIGSNEIHNQSIVAERDRLLHQTSDIIRERDNLRDQVSKHEITIDRLQNRNDALTREKLTLEQDLQGAEEAFNSLHQQYARSELLVKDLKDDNLRVERQYEGLYNSNQHLQQENAELERKNSDLQSEVTKLQNRVAELNRELSQKMDTQYAQQIQGAVPSLSKEKLTKMTHNWESSDRFTVVSETSAKATTSRMHRMHLPHRDSDTRETNLTRDSRRSSQESRASIPMNSKSKLAKLAHGEPEDRNTVASEMSAKTTTSHMDLQMQDDYAQQIDLTREPQVEIDDENMTSALFIDDITMDSNKKFAQKKKSKHAHTVRVMSPVLSDTEPSIHMEQKTAEKSKGKAPAQVLSPSAKHVLTNLEDHECNNCAVCTRIRSGRHVSSEECGKRTVRIERTMSVTDRAKKQTSTSDYTYEDQPTLRPSQDPAIAFAKVKKVLEDEKKHLELDLAQKMADYNTCDAAVGKRHWRKLDAEITILRKRLALKREQIYNLHDVEVNLEKANGQWTIPETVDMTIASVMSKDPTWNGIY